MIGHPNVTSLTQESTGIGIFDVTSIRVSLGHQREEIVFFGDDLAPRSFAGYNIVSPGVPRNRN